MAVDILYHPDVIKDDIPNLSGDIAKRIKKAIENKLATHPELYGEPLRGTLVPLWKLRVDDWWIVYDIWEDAVYIHAIGHRRNIYNNIILKRK